MAGRGVAAATGDRHAEKPALDYSAIARRAWITRHRNALLRAAASAVAEPLPIRALVIHEPAAHRQARRMLDSMREFGFDPGGYWEVPVGAGHDVETGYTYRQAGDPIFHTLGQVAGVDATRAHVIEALAAVVDGRVPKLPPRMVRALPEAVALVAAALADGRRIVQAGDAGTVRIEGPLLPPNWDSLASPVDATTYS